MRKVVAALTFAVLAGCLHRATPPAAAPQELTLIPTDEWLVAIPPDDPSRKGMDVVLESLLRCSFVLPKEGDESHPGIRWTKASAKDGAIQHEAFEGVMYAATRVTLQEPTGVVARADGVTVIFANDIPQPGDPYRSGAHRVPLRLERGENVIVAGCIWRGAPPVIRLETTSAPIAFNLSDVTMPDLRVGETTEQYVGVPVLNLTDEPFVEVRANVESSPDWEMTSMRLPAIGPRCVTKVPFRLKPRRAPTEKGQKVAAQLRLKARGLAPQACEISVPTVETDACFKRTFLSTIDNSAQYYAVRAPLPFEPEKAYGLVLSLHGASVEAIGQAQAYSAKDWCYVVCPTNRRPFGFDWEDWGRLDALEVLDRAAETFHTDPTRVHLTGHSMGGHGTWNIGVLHADRFAVIAPSAGWCSFSEYGGTRSPTGRGVSEAFARAAASSETQNYLSNLTGHGVYIIHGEADDNVPVEQGRAMRDRVKEFCPDVVYHEQPGAGHWWDGDAAKGADCVDWPGLFEFMKERQVGNTPAMAPQTHPGILSPYKEVLSRPFCFVYPDDMPRYRHYASHMISTWCIRGNGLSFALPVSRLTGEIRERYNIVYLGVPQREVVTRLDPPFHWREDQLELGGGDHANAAAVFVYPASEPDRLLAWVGATRGSEPLVFVLNPFRSGLGIPDYVIWDEGVIRGGWAGALRAGFFDSMWRYDERHMRR